MGHSALSSVLYKYFNATSSVVYIVVIILYIYALYNKTHVVLLHLVTYGYFIMMELFACLLACFRLLPSKV